MISVRRREKRNWNGESTLEGRELKSDAWGVARKLKEIGQAMDSITTQNNLADFLKDPENAQRLNSLIEDIRYAFMDYRVRTPKGLAANVSNIYLRPRSSGKSMTKAVRIL